VYIAGSINNGAPAPVAIQFYTAAAPCGDASDSSTGHGTFCAGVAAGSLPPPRAPSGFAAPAASGGGAGAGWITGGQRTAAGMYQGVARGAKLVVQVRTACPPYTRRPYTPLSCTRTQTLDPAAAARAGVLAREQATTREASKAHSCMREARGAV
jgi:hypothetical protein